MASVYTVAQVTEYIKNMFLNDFALKRICVRGEVSNCKYHSSGHIYFTLKDVGGTLSAVMFASRRGGLSFRLEDGMQVEAEGSIEVYERSGTYQLYARAIRQAGLGELYEKFVQMRDRLAEMGMFDASYKQPIPAYARTIGIVTASTGAALQDIINITTRRNPYVQLVLCPAQVQGAGAAESIARSIRTLDAWGPDVMIVGRGGGSLEDLWAFNEEIVARAIFEASTPVISAVGHETDVTIADYVADLRAPTPSAAAELAAFDRRLFDARLEELGMDLKQAEEALLAEVKDRTDRDRLRLDLLSPGHRVRELKMRQEDAKLRLQRGMQDAVLQRRHAMALLAERLKGLSPLEKISSGYAWISTPEGTHIRSASELAPGMAVDISFADGRARAEIMEAEHGRDQRNER